MKSKQRESVHLEPLLVQPTLHCLAHFKEMTFEEVIARDEYQFFWLGGGCDYLLQGFMRAKLIVVAADE